MTRADGASVSRLTLRWLVATVTEHGERYVDHVSACGRFRLERGYGRPNAAGVHDGWAVLERDTNGRMRWREDASSVADAKRRAELRAGARAESNAA